MDQLPIPAPLRLHRTQVRPEWVDYNDHMSEWCYLLVFGDGSDAFFRYVGVDDAYRAAGHSLFTVETHLCHHGEAKLGEELELSLQVLDLDTKRLHIVHSLVRSGTEVPLATAEQMLLHVDTAAGRVEPFPSHLLARLERIKVVHSYLPRPTAVGRVMKIPNPQN